MTPHPPDEPAPVRRLPRRRPWWVLVGVFLAGLVAGVLLVGLLSVGTPDFVSQSRATGAPAPPDPSSSVEVAAEARVNAACLRVINDAQDVYSALAGLDEAATEVDLAALDDIVRRLQPVEPRLARDLQECEVVVEEGGPGGEPTPGPPGSSTPAPAPTPSATR